MCIRDRFWAQQNYESPREATGKIVCANCHLAQMPTIAEVPQSVGADSVFKAVVKIPYKNDLKEIGADGSEPTDCGTSAIVGI